MEVARKIGALKQRQGHAEPSQHVACVDLSRRVCLELKAAPSHSTCRQEKDRHPIQVPRAILHGHVHVHAKDAALGQHVHADFGLPSDEPGCTYGHRQGQQHLPVKEGDLDGCAPTNQHIRHAVVAQNNQKWQGALPTRTDVPI